MFGAADSAARPAESIIARDADIARPARRDAASASPAAR